MHPLGWVLQFCNVKRLFGALFTLTTFSRLPSDICPSGSVGQGSRSASSWRQGSPAWPTGRGGGRVPPRTNQSWSSGPGAGETHREVPWVQGRGKSGAGGGCREARSCLSMWLAQRQRGRFLRMPAEGLSSAGPELFGYINEYGCLLWLRSVSLSVCHLRVLMNTDRDRAY